MAAAREIISLQFGHYSNFVGTHFWNIQESLFNYDPDDPKKSEINHDCLFRVGRTLDGQETYTPRLLLFDLKGSLRNFSVEGALYSSTSKAVEWEGGLSVHEYNSEPKNEFQMDIDELCDSNSASNTNSMSEQAEGSSRTKWYNLDDYVSVWSDFVGTQYHPKSVNIINEYSHNADHFAFDIFGYGQSLYVDKGMRDDFETNLHFFVEECDQLQGFQVLTDVHDGFAGLSAQVIEDLSDEYSSKSIQTFGFLPATFPGSTEVKAAHRLLNIALSYNQLSEHSTVFTPLSLARQGWFKTRRPAEFPYLTYKPNLAYHTSAVLASTIDTLTIPYRLDTVLKCHMDDLANSLTFGGRKITSASCSFPLPVASDKPLRSLLNSALNSKQSDLLVPLTPNVSQVDQLMSQVAVLRGNMPSAQTTELEQPTKKSKCFIDSCQSSLEMLNVYSQASNPLGVNAAWVVGQPCKVTPPFPNFFSSTVNKTGMVEEGYQRDSKTVVEQVNILASLGTSTSVGQMLQSLVKLSRKVNIKKHNCFIESGIEYESFMSVLENLESLADNYQE